MDPTQSAQPSTKEFLGTLATFRLAQLREMIKDPAFSHQKVNLAVAIKMYEKGELPEPNGRFTWFVNGKVMPKNWWPKSIGEGVVLWNEVRLKTILYFHVAYLISREYIFK